MSTPEIQVVYGADDAYIDTLTAQDVPVYREDARVRHPMRTVALHWASAGAMLVAVAAVLLREVTENDAIRLFLLETHRQLGLVVLLAAGLRIANRLRQPLADHARETRWILRFAATATHLLIYGLLFALPLEGWALMSAHEVDLSLFGFFNLPPLIGEDADLADTLGDIHVRLAWVMLALVALHVAGALWHHYIKRDHVLKAMLPAGPPR